MDTRRHPFFELIREHPEDDAPRLVYADWLDEQGDPRGEFIRIQCELAHVPCRDTARVDMGRFVKLVERERSLLHAFQEKWLDSLRDFQVRKFQFRRGFLAEAGLSPGRSPRDGDWNFSQNWETLIAYEPGLESVGLYFYQDWNDIQQLQLAPPIRCLHLNYQALTRREVSTLLRWPIIRGLKSLDLSHNNLRSGVDCVANAPAIMPLETLDLSFNHIGTRGAKVLASSPYLWGLRTLKMRGNHIGREGKQMLRSVFGPRVQL